MKKRSSMIAMLASLLLLPSLRAEAIGYGQGKECDAQNRPTGAVSFQDEFRQYGAYSLTPDDSRIILTFDQGYENGYTAGILDTLHEKNVSAIFFLTGDYAEREPELVRRMIREGHMLGNHGMKHAALPELDDAAIEEEIMSLHKYMQKNYDYEMQYFRPPCGEYDPRALAKIQSLGYRTIFWSAAHVDWKTDAQPDPVQALEQLSESAHGGAIYLLHSVSSTNAQILGDLIDELREKGYTV